VIRLSADWMVIGKRKIEKEQNISFDGMYKGRIKTYRQKL
jgi:hypothetical protein